MIVSLCRQEYDRLHSCTLGDVSLQDVTVRGGVLFHSPVGVLAIVQNAETASCEDAREVVEWLEEYFAGKRPEWMPVLHLTGTPFQKKVWALLKEIPYGQTTSYGALAARLSWTDSGGSYHKMSAQAVGQAVGANPCCILIPCHRVIASTGALGGYAHGPVIKKALLDFESGDFGANGISLSYR